MRTQAERDLVNAKCKYWRGVYKTKADEHMDQRNRDRGGMLTCHICKEVLVFTEFRRQRSRPFGRASDCRECHNAEGREWKAARRRDERAP